MSYVNGWYLVTMVSLMEGTPVTIALMSISPGVLGQGQLIP